MSPALKVAMTGKREMMMYDYVDCSAPVLARMAAKREKGYRAPGYVMDGS